VRNVDGSELTLDVEHAPHKVQLRITRVNFNSGVPRAQAG